MANITLSPNMDLPVPQVGLDSGPQYATDINTCLTLIDGHNHSPGYGVPISSSGINLTTDLPVNSNNLTLVRSVRFTPQSVAIPATSPDIGSVYVAGLDLWYNDLAGNQVQLTSGGLVNATSSGISDGTASATFSAGVLVVDAAANTPANIQAASLLMGNNVANSHYLTLSPPSAMGANYNVTLPALPSSTSFMLMNTSGVMSASVTLDGTLRISANQLGVNPHSLDGTSLINNIGLNGKAVQESGLNVVVSNTNATNSLAIVRGTVNTSSAAIMAGEGFSVVRNGSGDVTINFTAAFGDTPVVVASSEGGTGPNTAQVISPISTSVRILSFVVSTKADNVISFIAIGQRS